MTPSTKAQAALALQRDPDGKIFSHVRQKWLVETPEERVRQEYLLILVNEYGFGLDQIGEERDLSGRGAAQARADFVIWRGTADKKNNNAPFIIVECKADSITIGENDYMQGELYARNVGAPFFVTHNSKETRYWRVQKDKMPGYRVEIENIPHADDSEKDIEKLLAKLKTFREDEFARLLHDCHNIIRNREKLDPAAAFDEIAKILFVKVYVERELRSKRAAKNLFSVEVLDQQFGEDPINALFDRTKEYYQTDHIFESGERINLKPATSRAIVEKLEAYNLSDTGEDIKGIAFERFLGRTFRGEIGQFFTPRPIVEFMTRLVAPGEGDVILDPASGSGGFLIRFFEIVREQIEGNIDQDLRAYSAELDADTSLTDEERAGRRLERYDTLRRELDQRREGSRMWRLANRCVYGTDANERMARTSKMNMIMHGDGHGGVHHHDGLVNVNGIFEGRFDVILTNPPFGANVEGSDRVHVAELAAETRRRYDEAYGQAYREAQAQAEAQQGQRLLEIFDLGRPRSGKLSDSSKVKTEILFLERCLSLLKPGGRLAVVLPEGILNNPSLGYVREYCENRAKLRAVISLPPETFLSSGATVKTSIVYLRKFTDEERRAYEAAQAAARAEVETRHQPERVQEGARLARELQAAKAACDKPKQAALKAERLAFEKRLAQASEQETRALTRERFDYPIFFYEAQRVGITSTGEPDRNELYGDDLPEGLDRSCLDLFRDFERDPAAFLEEGA
ncbi:N-6 DNA methylase [Deinococcus aestuarii]|uniref:N-6 DNA methylase n=1 Tax=Deinococcus aestuarii TaxID=2774531 RepID=UPI001C0E850D|nr:N-6 DNA methylase [Deinococcus aestuarii]